MIREFLEPVKLSIIEAMFQGVGSGMSLKAIQATLPRNSRNVEKHVSELINAKVLVCENQEAPENERLYQGNVKSRIFRALFNLDVTLSDMEYVRKRKLRAQLFMKK